MRRVRDPHDPDARAHAEADAAARAGKTARTDDLPAVQRKPAGSTAPPQLPFVPAPARAADDPFGLHVQMKGNGKARREGKSEDLLDDLSDDERGKLQVVTASNKQTPPLLMSESQIDDVFPSEDGITTYAAPDDVEVKLASNIDAGLADGITNIAGKLAAHDSMPLKANTTMTLLLDLRKHGGPLGTFRFTYVDRPDKKKKKGAGKDQILVELVSTGGNDSLTADQAKNARAKLDANGLKVEGYSKKEHAALCHAVLLVPDRALAKISGATFKRASASEDVPTAGGDYDEAAHTITMYDRAFVIEDSLGRSHDMDGLGARNVAADGTRSDESVRLIAHEIGHAVDYAPIRTKASKKATRSSAHATKKTDVTAEFKDAVAADGKKPLTDYAETGWGEQYAEAFSFYVTDPALLAQLRPKVFAYFESQLA
jgi:hypothetical protein